MPATLDSTTISPYSVSTSQYINTGLDLIMSDMTTMTSSTQLLYHVKIFVLFRGVHLNIPKTVKVSSYFLYDTPEQIK